MADLGARDRLSFAAYAVAGLAAVALIGWLFLRQAHGGASAGSSLPGINAGFNLASASCLVLGYAFIRRGRIAYHRACMLLALAFSAAFFAGYLAYHARFGDTPFAGQGWIRPVYFGILIPHVILSIPLLPLALVAAHLGLRDRRAAHRRLARVLWPAWMFVSLSGVAIYVLLHAIPWGRT